MRTFAILNVASLTLAALLCTVSAPSFAATAHNSQAGSMGPTSHTQGATVNSPRYRHVHRKAM